MRAAVLLLLSFAACVGFDPAAAQGSGRATFTTWGEDFIERGIPEDAFVDGWSVTFSRFLVAVDQVTLASEDGGVGAQMDRPRVFDLVKPGEKHVVSFANVTARRWPRVSFVLGRATADSDLGEGATERDRAALMHATLVVSGTATKKETNKRFDWSFDAPTLYDRCEGPRGGALVQGALVTAKGNDVNQITVHGDHLFHDDLAANDAALRFEAIARADADGDGTVTLEELARVELSALPREEGRYGTGGLDVRDLRAFVTALARTIAHYRGEGECRARALR